MVTGATIVVIGATIVVIGARTGAMTAVTAEGIGADGVEDRDCSGSCGPARLKDPCGSWR